MRGHVGSSHISDRAAYENVRDEVLFPGDAGEADASCQSVHAPLEPRLMRIAVRNDAGKREARRGVPGRKRSAAFPKLAVSVCGVGILTVGGLFDSEADQARSSHGFERSEAGIGRVR